MFGQLPKLCLGTLGFRHLLCLQVLGYMSLPTTIAAIPYHMPPKDLDFDNVPSPFHEYNKQCTFPNCSRWFKGQVGLNQHINRSHPVRNYSLVLTLANSLPETYNCFERLKFSFSQWGSGFVRPLSESSKILGPDNTLV